MTILQTGVIGTSLKENEKRVPIHPDHFSDIAPEIREKLLFEKGYGEQFGVSDQEISEQMGGVASREELLGKCDISILCKPMASDLKQIKEGGVLWGWAHCVQQFELTQVAIDRKLSLITWEGMNSWDKDGNWASHVFYRNNEIAGYAGVLHAFGLKGIDGEYGPVRKAAVIGFGSVGQGAVRALLALGFSDVTLYVLNDPASLKNVPSGVKVEKIEGQGDGSVLVNSVPFISELEKMDVIVNGILQDPIKPLTYLSEAQTDKLKKGILIIDISCDEGMGFPFARPTNFEEPMISIGNLSYYAVDHTPTYLWDGASWEISKALLPYLQTVLSGADNWGQDESVRRAVEMSEGKIINRDILTFQKREAEYPHKIM